MPFGFAKKDIRQYSTKVTDAEELQDISKISEMLNPDEKVLLVAKQSRIKPGGSYLTPNIIYATDRRIIIRDPYLLGLKENIVDIPYDIITSVKLEKNILSSTIRFKAPGLVSSKKLGTMEEIVDGQAAEQGGKIEAISKKKAEDLIEIIRSGMQSKDSRSFQQQPQELSEQQVFLPSVADELSKLAKLKEQGIITEEEFLQMKRDLINRSIKS
jgi:Bacterial PH domain/Short C-terminal domain